jgi:diacylglycerol kinase
MAGHPLWQAFRYAFRGVWHCICGERNMKVHLAAMVVALSLAWWLELSRDEWMLLILTIALVLIAEMFNTALEAVVDLVSPEYDPLAKIAKDVAAGAVLLAALAAVAIGYLLFFSRFMYRW